MDLNVAMVEHFIEVERKVPEAVLSQFGMGWRCVLYGLEYNSPLHHYLVTRSSLAGQFNSRLQQTVAFGRRFAPPSCARS